jgi:tetratricopeptide (TPR) repeat protein/tRNA A-37 threonylcarbamoyl transferase component Bud32
MPDMSGRTLGKYRLIERLGRGGMAEVYRAYQPSLDRDVAIKVMHGYMVEDDEFVGRFGREARAVASLHHPHIVQMYDFDADAGTYFMVMEYIGGETLKARLERLAAEDRRMPLEEAARNFCALCDALDYAHAQGCVHRDIKPANVMFENDRLMLTDFGLATIAGGTRFTVTGTILGTPAYMSPEQGRGEPGDVRSDIYALGVMLYEVVTGQVPFDADTPLAIVYKHLNEPLPIPTQLNPDIPPAVERVILKALAKAPDDRFQSAGALADALSAAVGGEELPAQVYEIVSPEPLTEPSAETVVTQPPPAKPARRKWLPLVLGGAGALLLAGLAAAVILFVLPGLGPGSGDGEEPVGTSVPVAGFTPTAPHKKPPSSSPDVKVQSEALAHYEEGVRILFEEMDPRRALPELARAIEIDPGFAEAYHMRGVAHQMMGEYQRAEGDYSEAIARKPDLAAAYLDRGRMFLHDLQRDDEALADLNMAIEIDPGLAPAYVERARYYMWHGGEERARADAERALELDPNLAEALTMAGEFHYKRFECEEAIPYLSRSVEIMPEDPWPWEMLGQCYHELGQYDKALATYDMGLRANQDEVWLRYGRAFVHLELGDVEAAMKDFEHALRIDPGFAGARYGRGLAHVASGRYEEAIADFTWVIENAHEDEYVWPYFLDTHPLVDRAAAHYELGDVDAAFADLNALMERIPDFHIAYYYRGLLHKELGQIDEARADLEEAWRLAPDPEWKAKVDEELEGLD